MNALSAIGWGIAIAMTILFIASMEPVFNDSDAIPQGVDYIYDHRTGDIRAVR